MSTAETTDDRDAPTSEHPDDDRRALEARVASLEAENRRLREAYGHARRATYRRTALGLAAVGLLALAGGLVFPAERPVFVTLGAIGLFGAVLTHSLTPERFVAADVGERVYTAGSRNLAALSRALGLRSTTCYLPSEGTVPARLFVPLYAAYALPDGEGPLALAGDARGLVLEPTGGELLREFDRARTAPLAAEPAALAAQLCDGLVEGFELATSATPEVDPGGDRVTVAVSGSAFGVVDRFDHPIPSFLAAGLAAGLERPVTVDVAAGDDRADWLVTCQLDAADGPNDALERR